MRLALFLGGALFGALLYKAHLSPWTPIYWVLTVSFTLVWAVAVMTAFRRRA